MGAEFRFTLPYNGIDGFGPLLTTIEERSRELQVSDYELAMTSLEEVFMALGKEADERDATHGGALEFQELEQAQEESERASMSWGEQVRILFKLRVAEVSADRRIFFWTLIFPLALSIYGFFAAMGYKNNGKAMSGDVSEWPGMSVSFTCIPFMSRMVRERESKVRHVMISQGMTPSAYWAATLSQTCLQTLIVALLFPIMSMITHQDFQTQGRIVFVWAAALLSPIPTVLFFGNLAMLFKTEEGAMKAAPAVSIFLGLLPPLAPNIMWGISTSGTVDSIATILHWVFSFIDPLYLISGTFIGTWRAGGAPSYDTSRDVVVGKGLGYWLQCSIIWAPFIGQACLSSFFLRNLLRDGTGRRAMAPAAPDALSRKDEDVLKEEQRVQSTTPQQEAFCIRTCTIHTMLEVGLQCQRSVASPLGFDEENALVCSAQTAPARPQRSHASQVR